MTDNSDSALQTMPFSRTLSEQVASQLRRSILNGQLKPGQRIVEREIADGMRLSRGPIRDALKLLENEGLVVRYAHRGTFVAWLTLHDAEEIYSMREAIEMLAVDYTIKCASDAQMAELDQIVNQMEQRLSTTDYTQDDATGLDLQFHEVLCRISGHDRVLSGWHSLQAQVRLLLLTHRILQPVDFRERGVDSHRRLVIALQRRDIAQAHETLHQHLADSYETMVSAIRSNNIQPPFEGEAESGELEKWA
jgi:DNA-binding GntR family transcriptional regulator